MKKLKVAVIIFFLCIMCACNCFATSFYSDIAGTPYEGAIEALTELGVVNGFEDGTFRPLETTSRAEYTKLLVIASGLSNEFENAKNETCIYTDVEEANHWAKGYINIANEYGFIMGYDDGTFKPENAITCQEAVIYTLRALGYKYTLEEAYITKAEELNLVDTLVFSSYSDELTRGNACNLLWAMLKTPMWDIEDGKIKLPVPEFKRFADETIEYNGEEQTVELKNFSDDLMTITNNKQKEIGKYDIIISLKNPNEYEWEIYNEDTGKYTYTTEPQILKWEIVIAELRIPYQRNSKEYNGQEQEPNLKYYNYDDHKYLISISGDCKATEVGTYIATASLIDKSRSIWEDGTTEDKNVVWQIVTNKTNVPKQNRVIEYTGEEQSFKLYDYQKDIMTITGNKATNAGKYIAKVSLKDKKHYEWAVYDEQIEDYIYTTDDQEFEWEISTKKLNVPKRDGYYDIEYTGQEQLLNLRYYGYDEEIINIVGNKATDVGKYTATVSLKDKNNYEWKLYDEQSKLYTLYTTEDQNIEWEIVIGKLCLPRINLQKNYYNGKEISTSFTYYIYDSFVDSEMKADNEEIKNIKNLITITNDKATNAGTHIVKVSLKDKENFVWRIRDEKNNKWVFSNEDQEFDWEIEKGSVYIPKQQSNNRYETINEYTGNEQTVELDWHYDENKMTLINGTAKDVGTYYAKVSLIDKNNYQWQIYDKTTQKYSYTTEDQEIEWKINKIALDVPYFTSNDPMIFDTEEERHLSIKQLKYNGKIQDVNNNRWYIYNYESGVGFVLDYLTNLSNLIEVSGDTSKKDVGKYQIEVLIKDKEHYEWRICEEVNSYVSTYWAATFNRTTDNQVFDWEITKASLNVETSNLTQIEDSITAPTYVLQPLVTNGIVEVYYSQVAHAKESDGDGLSVGWKGVINGDKLPWENETLKDGEISYPWFAWGENLEVTGTIDLQFEKDKLPTKAGSYVYAIVVSGDSNIANGCYLDELKIREKTATNNNNNNNTQSGVGSSSGGGGGSSSSTITYKATITQTKGGTITVDKTEVEKGEKQVFTIVADTGYKIVDVKVDGKSVGAVSTYTIEKVTKKHKITATFEKLTEEELKELEEDKETTWVNTFEDVTTNDWYYEAVKFVNEAGLFKGLSDKEFGAKVTMNRAMIVTVLHRLAGETKASNSNVNFNDVSTEEYYTNAVIWAVENGIVNGVGNNEFAPQNNVTREQLIVMLYRYAKLNENLEEEQTSLSNYDDVNLISDYAEEAFAWAIQKGIITGRTTTTLAPQGIATRAEVATMIMRFSNMINEA